MSRFMTYLYWMPFAAGAALPKRVVELTELSVKLTARDNDRNIITDPDTGRSFVPGETSTDRTIYNAVALFCVIVLAVFLGESSLASPAARLTSETNPCSTVF